MIKSWQTILEAGFRASTTGNMQVYSVIVSKDPEKRKELCKMHFGQKMVEQAPVLLTFCADFNRFNKWCHQREAEPGYDNFLSFLLQPLMLCWLPRMWLLQQKPMVSEYATLEQQLIRPIR
jgi:nitroreductase